MLRRCADSVGGACFGDADGNVVFRARDWLFYTSDTPLDGTIGNQSVQYYTRYGIPADNYWDWQLGATATVWMSASGPTTNTPA